MVGISWSWRSELSVVHWPTKVEKVHLLVVMIINEKFGPGWYV